MEVASVVRGYCRVSRGVRRPRCLACSIMKGLEHRLLDRAPGNPLACFWSCRHYYQYQAHYHYVLCCLDLQSTTPFDEHYTCIISVKLIVDYSRIMLYAFADQLFWKLCRYIRRISNICTRKGWNSGCIHPLVNIHSYGIQLLFQPIVTLNSLVASNLS